MSLRLVAVIAFLLPLVVGAQTSYKFKIPTERLLFHDLVDKQQKLLFNPADTVELSDNEAINIHVEDVIVRQVDEMQEQIETDTTLNGQGKVKSLKSLETLLRGYQVHKGNKDYPVSMAPAMFDAFKEAMYLDRKGESIEPVIIKNTYGVGKILIDCFLLPSENVGVKSSRTILTQKYLELHPDQILPELSRNPNFPLADHFIQVAAHRDIRKLYDYAAARNALGSRIRNHPDSLVRTIGTIASSKSGQLYFPFLDNLMTGKITLAQIDSVKDNDFAYYRLMVQTRIEYAKRSLPPYRDTILGMKALNDRMSVKAKQYFIREINALHSEQDKIRYERIEGLTPQELYYLIVLGEDEIYTSSYLSVYKKIWERMPVSCGDSLLLSVNGDYFRKFIKMAAGYNTLNDFLDRMNNDNHTTTMKAFVIGLEATEGLEEAVDVADSYSSIMDKNPSLAKYILDEVKWNHERNIANSNKRGIVIYNLLKILFESADTMSKIDLSAQLGIPSIYSQDYLSLTDDSGRVIQQVFFYGDEDKDGQFSYENFMKMFKGKPEWKIESNDSWTSIISTKGKPVWIFANKPLFGFDDPDARAQKELNAYLEQMKLKPTVVIHRGHSYHLPYTLKQLAPSAKIVVLGSCGGYNNLNEVLSVCEDAHIISSKQVGTKTVNEPILQEINNSLVAGRNIDWIPTWKSLSTKFTDDKAKQMFDDYIPPYKNLGAIFIKAYKRSMGD